MGLARRNRAGLARSLLGDEGGLDPAGWAIRPVSALCDPLPKERYLLPGQLVADGRHRLFCALILCDDGENAARLGFSGHDHSAPHRPHPGLEVGAFGEDPGVVANGTLIGENRLDALRKAYPYPGGFLGGVFRSGWSGGTRNWVDLRAAGQQRETGNDAEEVLAEIHRRHHEQI